MVGTSRRYTAVDLAPTLLMLDRGFETRPGGVVPEQELGDRVPVGNPQRAHWQAARFDSPQRHAARFAIPAAAQQQPLTGKIPSHRRDNYSAGSGPLLLSRMAAVIFYFMAEKCGESVA